MTWQSLFAANPALTYKQAREKIFDYLRSAGWKVTTFSTRTMRPLKTPYATSPDGSIKLWFHPQSVYVGETPGGTHSLHVDMKTDSPEAIVHAAESYSIR